MERSKRTARPVTKHPEQGGPVVGQVPIDSRPGYITELTFSLVSGAVAFRTIATNVTSVGSYRQGTEYWYDDAQALGDALTMTGAVSTFTATQLDGFHASSTFAFQLAQDIGTSGWTRGTYTPTSGEAATLYKAPDPDNPRTYVGVLFQQSTRNDLTKVVWYKTEDTGTIWAATPASISWTQVFTASGAPSTDPNDILSGTTWYYAAGP